MSLALYRKYRPATFAELKGQEHVAEPLQQALRNGRINHAYLFSGPRGCGKTSSARILARSLNCEEGPTPDPCGKCDSCVALGPSGTGHIDVIEIDAASHGGVDDARDLRERAFFAPVSARFKVYIIDEAHMVTREGFNALLKLVEEPPPHLKFVFATTEPEKVIGTIRSRTHHYPFRLIPPGVLQELVEEILKSEDVPYEASALPLAVRAGAGSARDTLSILDQLLAGSDEQGITYARAVSLLGYTDSALLDEVIAAFAARDGAAVFAAIDRVVESGQDPRRFTADLLERIRDLVILSNVPEAGGTGLLNVPADELEQMRRQAASMGPGELTRAADLLHTGLTEMRGATSPRLLLELISARILLPAAYEDEASMLARLDQLERRAAAGGFGGGQGGAVPGGGGAGMAPAFPSGAPASGASPMPQGPGPAAGPGQRPGPSSSGGRQEQRPAEQPPTAQGGDPTSSVNRPGTASEAERGSVDNRSASGPSGPSGPSSPGGPTGSGGPSGSAGSAGSGGSSGPSSSSGSGGSGGAGASGRVGGPSGPGGPGGPGGPSGSSGSGGLSGSGGSGSSGQPGGTGGASRQDAAPAAPSSGGGMDVATVQQYWPDIVEAVKQKSRATWMVIMSGVRPVSLEGRVLTLSFDAEGSRLGFVNGNRDVILCEVFKEHLKVDWRIETVVGGAPPAGGRGGPNPGGAPRGGGGGGGGQGGQSPRSAPGSGFGTASSSGFGSAQATQPAASPARAGAPQGPGSARSAAGGDPGPPPPPPDEPPPPPEPSPVDESDEVDPEGDADAEGNEAEMNGMALIQRELGGQIIREIDNS
ncbi:DNA polymerase III subunit gamma and tau [Actinomadura graeca]|uniref:DNA-directed DNA polymerase n=1 Tax=Actinomadura graeca TaxID=2750812 RepID=A0ABX8QYN2_9ACTN|nr:DNA polymerase III subunit gamma and tau [Actinomadura graeca]QXJ23094.1 DNA polymerase III subunit gamma and tau [Actinomadura graeca]